MNSAPEPLPPISEKDRENLSAYLDGELGDEATEEVVALLGRRQDVRTVAEELKKTWDLLDYLPRPQAPENFTEKTLHKLDTTKVVLLGRERRWRRAAVVGWAVTLLLAGVMGFIGAFYWPQEQPPQTPANAENTQPQVADNSKEIKEVHDRLNSPPLLRKMDERVRGNVNRILKELHTKVKDDKEWLKIRRDLMDAARYGTWEYLDELRRLALKYQIPLESPNFPPRQRPTSPGDENRPAKPKGTGKKGQE
jgi:hypothetical protein